MKIYLSSKRRKTVFLRFVGRSAINETEEKQIYKRKTNRSLLIYTWYILKRELISNVKKLLEFRLMKFLVEEQW